MNLFADYIQPLTDWLQANPRWSLFITFIISLTESLAIIGSIIPGSVTMTAIGILAGSGIMRVDLTLAAATLGAVCGDSLSYALGFFYSERLTEIWPFRKYPQWFEYGKNFFAKHGGKSVLFGRFIGPLRSLIPVIAGILHMKQWRFLTANILSALGWAILYVMPGVLIGAASHNLSTESATRLFVIILLGLAGIWFISLILKGLFSKLNSFLKKYLHHTWLKLKPSSGLSGLYYALTPTAEKNHYPTALLFISSIVCLFSFILLTLLSIKINNLSFINDPLHMAMQSFHTPLFKTIFIICTQLTGTITIICFYIICCLWFLYRKNIKATLYFTNIFILSIALVWIMSTLIPIPRPPGLQVTPPGSSFLAANIEIATALYGFIWFHVNNQYTLVTQCIRSFILIALGLSGLGALYLGDYWFTDIVAAYFAGASIALIHYLIYRKSNVTLLKKTQSTTTLITLLAGILGAMAVSTYFNFKTLSYNHTPWSQEYRLKKSEWWDQQKPILPIYQLNRIGKKMSILNIQYVGSLSHLQKNLEAQGWQTHNESFFTKLLMKINTKSNEVKFPLLTQLYENKPPELIMTLEDPKSQLVLELEMWESNYTIIELNTPLWIGTIRQNLYDFKKKSNMKKTDGSLSHLIPAFKDFHLRRVELSKELIDPTVYPSDPVIVLIKERD